MYPPSRRAQPGRWLRTPAARLAGSLLLVLLLLLATLHNEDLYVFFDGWWHRAGQALGQSPPPLRPGSPVGLLLHKARSIPAIVLYSVLYLGLCLGLIFLLLPAQSSRRLVLLFYGGAGLATGFLLLGSQVGGGPELAVLASQLLHFIVSPLPVIVLVPLLRWAAAQPATT